MSLALVLAIELVAALTFLPALRLPPRPRLAALVAAALVIAGAPWLIPLEQWIARTLAVIVGSALVVKLYDLHRGLIAGHAPPMRDVLVYMANPSCVCLRRLHEEPRPPPRAVVGALVLSAAALAAGAGVFSLAQKEVTGPVPRHVFTIVPLFAVCLGVSGILTALWRLGGGQTRDMFGNCLTASTPAELWRRWNRPTYQFFHENVFLPAGGRRRPVRAALIVFVVSAVCHEYVATVINGRVEGYQLAFFGIQGLAVLATWRLKPDGPALIPAIAATLAFNIATSAIFLASIPGERFAAALIP
jgi:MBOAT membrane-bound O-acyltransferase family protein